MTPDLDTPLWITLPLAAVAALVLLVVELAERRAIRAREEADR